MLRSRPPKFHVSQVRRGIRREISWITDNFILNGRNLVAVLWKFGDKKRLCEKVIDESNFQVAAIKITTIHSVSID